MLQRARKYRRTVDGTWRGSKGRETFVRWSLANGFQFGLRLDRTKNHLGYGPDNCQWITQQENVAKERRTVEYQGKLYTKVELHAAFAIPEISYQRMIYRLNKGWLLKDALKRKPSSGDHSFLRKAQETYE